MKIEVIETDITEIDVDAIVNAANTDLELGGGVAGAIKRAAGDSIQKECRQKAPIELGAAIETEAGNLPCKWVIHAATMHLGGPTSAEIIRECTVNTLKLADKLGASSLALVAFGTGVGGFSLNRAAEIMVGEVSRFSSSGPTSLEKIVFTVRGSSAYKAFQAEIKKS